MRIFENTNLMQHNDTDDSKNAKSLEMAQTASCEITN